MFQAHLFIFQIITIVITTTTISTSYEAHLAEVESAPGEYQVPLSSHTERERIMANRQKNKAIEMNRQMMSVLSVVSKKRDVKEYVFDNSSQHLFDNLSHLGQFNLSTSQVQSQQSTDEVKKKHKNEGIKIINVTGTKTNHDVIEFNLPEMPILKKVTSVVLKVMVKSRKNLRKSMDKVKVKVYAPDIFLDARPSTGSPLYFGIDRNQRRSFFPISTTRQPHHKSADKRLKLISEIKIKPNKTKWAVIPISTWYIQEVLERNVTRLKFVIRCDQCKGIRRENDKRRNGTTKSAHNNSNTNVQLDPPYEAPLNDNRTSKTRHQNKSARRNVRHSNPKHQTKQQQQQQPRTHNYLPHILIYTKDV